MHVIVTLLAGCQSAILSSNEWHNDMNPAFISTIMAPNFEIKEITYLLMSWGPRGKSILCCPTYQRQQSTGGARVTKDARRALGALTFPPMVPGPHGGETSIRLHHPYLLRVPMVGRNQYGYMTPTFSGSPWWGDINMATSPLPSQGPHVGEKSIWLHHPCLLGVTMVGRNQPSKEWMWWK